MNGTEKSKMVVGRVTSPGLLTWRAVGRVLLKNLRMRTGATLEWAQQNAGCRKLDG